MKVQRFPVVVWLLTAVIGLSLLVGPGRAGAQQVIANSITDFSNVQGQANWYYGYYQTPNVPASFTQDAYFLTWGAWNEGPQTPPYDYVAAKYQHPRGTNDGGVEHWSVRRYVSPKAGTLLLQGTLKKADVSNPSSKGIFGHIFHNGQEVYVQFIGPVDGVGVNYSVKVLGVKVGDTIDFVVAPNGHSGNDATAFNAQIKLYTRFDYNGDGHPDLLFQNETTGGITLWTMDGINVLNRQFLYDSYDTDWKIVGAADFNGDAQTDLLLQSQSTHALSVWFMNGAVVSDRQFIVNGLPSNGILAAVGDFNGDGQPDLVFQNSVNGQVAIWLMNGLTRTSSVPLNVNPPPGWKVVAAADFNGDGQTDLLLQDTTSFTLRAYLMNGTSVSSQVQIYPASPNDVPISTDWHVVGAADFNGDGNIDILFQNQKSGAVTIWFMNGTNISSGVYILNRLDVKTWKVSGLR